MLVIMGKYDDEVVELYRSGKTPKQIQEILGISRKTEYAARKKAGLVPSRKRTVRVIDFIPERKHQRQHAYTMIMAIEREENKLPVPDKTRKAVKAFRRELAKKVWLYQRDGHGFYWIPRGEEHGDKIAIEV